MDRSEQDVSSFFGDLSRNLEEVCSWLRSSSGADHSPSTSFHGARNALQSLRSADATLSGDMSSSFSRSSNPQSAGTEPRRNRTLPSVARGRGSSHNWSSRRQSTFPYGRGTNARKPKNPRRFEMKLMVIDCIPELLSDNSITNYSGDTVVESSLTLLKDESPSDVKAKILRLIRKQFPDYEGQFFFASRRNKNRLSITADQDLDARGEYTLKGSGSVYVVLENSLTISEDEVSTTFFCAYETSPGQMAQVGVSASTSTLVLKNEDDGQEIKIDTSIPEADLLKPENETIHGVEDLRDGTAYTLFSLVVKSAGSERFYACVKEEQDEASDKCTLTKLLQLLMNSLDVNYEISTFQGVGTDDDCVIIKDIVHHEAVLHKMEKAMKDFIGLESLKQQFLCFTRTQLQNDRRKRLGHKVKDDTPLHLVFAGNPGTGKTTFAGRVAELLFSIKKIRKNKIIEVQRSDLVGQYLGWSTEKTRAKIDEARGGVLFVDREAYRLIPSAGGKDFGREAIEELMAVMEDGDPVMIFACYEKEMDKFLDQIFYLKASEKGFTINKVDIKRILEEKTSDDQRRHMNARLMRILLQESIEEASNRLPLDASLFQLTQIKEEDVVAACARLPTYSGNK
ncbi:unnamed protein product [Porites evermanni]|uniref:ATPase AAA-type core domain-containing protein n=1 Tax=Porites evermanni TaxID=104178 RepID=A0ABN8QQ38_9CNID|nr:unnamed protein product [Porites evermanni]